MNSLIKKNVKELVNRFGYDIKLHRIGKSQQHTGMAFIHVPKSGGISIDLALREQFAIAGQPRLSREGAIAMSLATFNQPIDGLDSISEFSDHHAQQLNGLLAYHLAQNWPYVSGHVCTNKQIIEQFSDDYNFVTVLREPISRFISNYIYNKLTNPLPMMAPNNINTDNLITEVDSILAHRRGWQMANVMSMCITGRFAKSQSDAIQIQHAFSDNLSQYKVIGFLDNITDFSAQIEKLTGKKINIGNHNTTDSFLDNDKQTVKNTLKTYFNEPHIKAKITELCHYDSENYLRAKEKYA